MVRNFHSRTEKYLGLVSLHANLWSIQVAPFQYILYCIHLDSYFHWIEVVWYNIYIYMHIALRWSSVRFAKLTILRLIRDLDLSIAVLHESIERNQLTLEYMNIPIWCVFVFNCKVLYYEIIQSNHSLFKTLRSRMYLAEVLPSLPLSREPPENGRCFELFLCCSIS